MTSRRQLNEGLRANDLAGMIEPVIMVDRHVPKLEAEEDAIVVAFQTRREESGHDLCDFIERGPFDVLDADVSPAPDENGNYYVFVELPRSHRSWAMLSKILDHTRRVTGIKRSEWQFLAPGDRDPFPLTEERYRSLITQTPYEYETEQDQAHQPEQTTVVPPQQESARNPVAERMKFLVKY